MIVSLGRLRGVRALLAWYGSDPLFFLPGGRGVSPSGEVWDACAARDFAREARINSLFLPPCGRGVSPSGEVWDACAARGKVGRLWGYAPFAAPLASPPKHPQRKFSASFRWRGHASYAAGASLTRSARSGDLPPRRVNAKVYFCLGCYSASAQSPQDC